MRFDWYTASIDKSPQLIVDTLASCYELADVLPTKPFNGYERAFKCIRGDTELFKIQYGGNTGTRVQVQATGEASPELATNVREMFTDHHVIRADVALDYCEPGAWESLYNLSTETADKFKLKTEHRGDFHRGENGRTFYIGSRQSPAFNRVYEKGKQLGGDPDHVRSEFELKPKNEAARAIYSKASPAEMLLAAKWSAHFYGILAGVNGMRLAAPGTIHRPSDDERALIALGTQYGGTLSRLLESMGGDLEGFGTYIAKLIVRPADKGAN